MKKLIAKWKSMDDWDFMAWAFLISYGGAMVVIAAAILYANVSK